MGCSCSSAESKASWRLPQKSLSLFPSGAPKSPVAAVSRRYSNLPFNSCRTPPSTGLRDASPCPQPVVGHQRAAVLSLFPAPFLNFTVSAELNQFSGGFPISLILQQTALRVRKGSVHIFKGTQAWEALLSCHCCDGDVSALAFPLFLTLLYSMFYCIWWGTLKGSCSEVILEDSLCTAMLFLTLFSMLFLQL